MAPRSLFTGLFPRSAIALLWALCIVAIQGELFLPDVHDGDRAAQVGFAGASNSEPLDAPHQPPSHAAHVDHCTHAHVFASVGHTAEPTVYVAATAAPDASGDRLSSVSTPPKLRPPIV